MSVPMLIPLTGLEELPSKPLMREATVTKRNPKITTRMPASKFWYQVVCASCTGAMVKSTNSKRMITAEPAITQLMGMSRSMRLASLLAGALFPSARTSFRPARRAEMIVGIVRIKVIHPRGHGSSGHRADVLAPHVVGRHLRNGNRGGIDRRISRELSEELNRRHHQQPGDHAARKKNSRHLWADDVAHSQVFRRDGGAEGSARKPARAHF